MAGKFELYSDKAGKFRFRLKAGKVIATGEAYASKNSALNGIESIRKNAAAHPWTTRPTSRTPSHTH